MVKRKNFQYLRSLIHKNWEIKEDVNRKIKASWLKWRGALRALCAHALRFL